MARENKQKANDVPDAPARHTSKSAIWQWKKRLDEVAQIWTKLQGQLFNI